MAKKIAVINNKGGSLKTTTTVNLAGAYANKYPSRRILIVETDGQGNATRSFGLKADTYEYTMYDVFMKNVTPKECVVNAFQNIDIIPASQDMNFVEFDEMNLFKDKMASSVTAAFRNSDIELTLDNLERVIKSQSGLTDAYFNMLDGMFNELDKEYDLIIFDTPPELKAVTSSVLAIIDHVIIPFEPDIYSLDGIRNILARVIPIKKDLNPKLEIAGLLAVKVRNRTNLHTEVINSVMKYCMREGLYYFQSEVPNTIKFADSISVKGLPATISTRKRNKFVDSYFDLLDELIDMKVV